MNTKYWVVGASWGGIDHQDKTFVKKGKKVSIQLYHIEGEPLRR